MRHFRSVTIAYSKVIRGDYILDYITIFKLENKDAINFVITFYNVMITVFITFVISKI